MLRQKKTSSFLNYSSFFTPAKPKAVSRIESAAEPSVSPVAVGEQSPAPILAKPSFLRPSRVVDEENDSTLRNNAAVLTAPVHKPAQVQDEPTEPIREKARNAVRPLKRTRPTEEEADLEPAVEEVVEEPKPKKKRTLKKKADEAGTKKGAKAKKRSAWEDEEDDEDIVAGLLEDDEEDEVLPLEDDESDKMVVDEPEPEPEPVIEVKSKERVAKKAAEKRQKEKEQEKAEEREEATSRQKELERKRAEDKERKEREKKERDEEKRAAAERRAQEQAELDRQDEIAHANAFNEKLVEKFRILKDKYVKLKEENETLSEKATKEVHVDEASKAKLVVAEAKIAELNALKASLEEQLKRASEDAQFAKDELKAYKLIQNVPKPVASPTPNKEEKLRLKKKRLEQSVDRLEQTNVALLRSNESLSLAMKGMEYQNMNLAQDKKDLEKRVSHILAQGISALEDSEAELRGSSESGSPLALALQRGFGHAISITKPSDERDTFYLTCQNVNNPKRRILFEISIVGGDMVQYSPLKMDGFSEEENVPEFVTNDIFFKEKHLPVFLAKLIIETGNEPKSS